jgi:transposase
VHICVLTLGYSRRQVIRVYRNQRQRNWLQALEEAFHFWGGIPEEVLVDNAKALITINNPKTGELVVNSNFAAFARHWGFTAKACWPNRPQTKGKDERGRCLSGKMSARCAGLCAACILLLLGH